MREKEAAHWSLYRLAATAARMALKSAVILALVIATVNCSTVTSDMTANCVVDGTEVELHCPGATEWHLSFSRYEDDIPPLDVLTFNASLGTSSNSRHLAIFCYITTFISTSLIIQSSSDPGIPMTITASPNTKSSLVLDWEDPYDFYGNTTYTVAVTFGDGEITTLETEESSVILEFAGKECQFFQVSVSMPGNCYPVYLNGTLLIDPPYPKPENIMTDILENKTAILTWTQPDNEFNENTFTYIIMAIGPNGLVEERHVTFDPTITPMEYFNLSSLEECSEVLFTLLQSGDCREQQFTTFIPIFLGSFLAELEAQALFSSTGELETVELKFKPPRLCDQQLKTGSYFFKISNLTTTWTEGPNALESSVVYFDRHRFIRDSLYNATVTVVTDKGNVSSSTTFNTFSPIYQDELDQDSLSLEIINDSSVINISWDNPSYSPCNSFVYEVSIIIKETEERVMEEMVVIMKDSAPSVVFDAEDYLCHELKVSVQIFNTHKVIYKLVQLPIHPVGFERNATADTFMVDGKIKELEVAFIAPKVCDFQRVTYKLEFSFGNETWSIPEIDITGIRSTVKEDIEEGFVVNTNYTMTVTVLVVGYGNFTSSAYFMFPYEEEDLPVTTHTHQLYSSTEILLLPIETSSPSHYNSIKLPHGTPEIEQLVSTQEESLSLAASIGGAVVVVMIIVCIAIGIGVCYIRSKRRQVVSLKARIKPNVTNPIYEAGDDVYEELPDPGKQYQNNTATYSDVAPPLPSARYDHLPPLLNIPTTTTDEKQDIKETIDSTTPTPKNDQSDDQLAIPSSGSCGALSAHSTAAEDCYTVMNPAGTITIMSRNRGSGAQWEAPTPGE